MTQNKDALEALKKMVGLTHFRDKKEVDLLAETIRAALQNQPETVDLDTIDAKSMGYKPTEPEYHAYNFAIEQVKRHKGKVIG